MIKRKKCTVVLLGALAAGTLFAGAMLIPQGEADNTASAQTITFDENNWEVVSGALTLDGGTQINTKDYAGDGKLLLRTSKTYSDFHLSYKVQYSQENTHGTPWEGYGGILIHGDREVANADGYYMGFYGWGGDLWCATGYYRNGGFSFLQGVNCGWSGAGYNENKIDVYVQGSHVNVLINDWLYQNAPLPYTESGVISLYSDGLDMTYKDIAAEELPEGYDITSKLVRANWQGSNITGDMFYWDKAGDNQSFRMRLPDSTEGVQNYYLVRRSKIADANQTVDVYVDKTATLALNDTWTEKVATWGDKANSCTHGGNFSMFGLNGVEIPVSAFNGVAGGAQAGFFLQKNIAGYYSAAEYWLLYRDSKGVLRVADYMDMAYGFDREAHSYEFAATCGGEKGHHFVCQNNGVITSHRRGQEVNIAAMPTLAKKADITHTFAFGDPAKEFALSDYVAFESNHTSAKITYSVDGGEAAEKLILPAATASGTVTVTCAPAGVSNDNSGNIWFDAVTVTLNYSTTREMPQTYLRKISDIAVNTTGGGAKIDLLDYVETNIEGEWSYTYGGSTKSGTEFTLPAESATGEIVLKVVPADGSEEKTVSLALSVTAYTYPAAVKLPYYQDGGAAGSEWLSLYGEVNAQGGKWTADSSHVWGALADFGTDSYSFSAFVNAKNEGGDADKFGFLIHASIELNGLSGMLVGLQFKGGALIATVGWLDNGKYTAFSQSDTYFASAQDYHVKFISDGSFVELMINGYRVFALSDRYNGGGKFAILNGGGEINYRGLKCAAFNDNIADYVFRTDWNGSDTYAKSVSWTEPFSVNFSLPQSATAKNFRLVRRTSYMGGEQRAAVSAGGTSYGTWSVAADNNQYGDSIFALNGFTAAGKNVEFTVTPQSAFSASYMWLIYEDNGEDYIADSVYLAHAEDAAAHGVQGGSTGAVEKQFIPSSHTMLLTAHAGEKAVWAREISVADKMQAKTYSDKNVSSAVELPYRLYLPEGYDSSREYPMMLFLHGAGERGTDNTAHITAGGVMGTELLLKRLILGEYGDDFIIVAPQCPANMRWVETDWTPGTYSFDGMAQSIPSQLVASLLYNDIFKNYSVDRSRVYGAGLSMGGFGIIDFAMRYPDLFAAVLNCSGGADPSKAELLSTTALRGYHSPSDPTVNYAALKSLIEDMNSKGLDAEYYEISNIYHYSWQVGFEDSDLIYWFLSHEKSWTVETVLNGGTLEENISQTYSYGLEDITLPAPAKLGYRFGGWYLNKDFEGEAVTSFNGKTARNLKLFAKWVKDVTVTVKTDGETLATLNVDSGSKVDLSQYTPVKAGHRHIGWTDGVNDYPVNASVAVEGDVTFTATWLAEKYTVNVYRGEELIFGQTFEYGAEIGFTAPAAEGYRFIGLFADEEMTQSAQMPLTATENVTLYAKYEEETPDVPDNPDNPDTPDDPEKPPVTPAETPKGGCGSVASSGNEIIVMLSACCMLLLTAAAVRVIRKKSK